MAWVLYTYNSMLILINSLQSFGFNLMATSNYHWLLSFSRAEQVLLSNIDEDGGCRRKCYWVVRQLKEDIWCPGSKPVITAYHLQVYQPIWNRLFICFLSSFLWFNLMWLLKHHTACIQKQVYTLFPLTSSRRCFSGHVRSTPAPGTGKTSGDAYYGWCKNYTSVLVSIISGITLYDPTTFWNTAILMSLMTWQRRSIISWTTQEHTFIRSSLCGLDGIDLC